MPAPVAIVGGGLAGLTMARVLRRERVPFVVYESSAAPGGLASSHHDADGFSDDVGAHFVTNRLADELGVRDRCYDVRRYGESVIVRGRTYRYPHGLIAVPRYVASALVTRARALRHPRPALTASEWFVDRYGEVLAHEIALPLLEAWSGRPASQLSAAVGKQMPGSIARSLFLKLASKISGRAVASGYCGEQPESPRVWHVYPRDGVRALTDRLAEEAKDSLHCNARVEAIYVDRAAISGIRVDGRDIAASIVVSTAPLHVLAKLVHGTTALAGLARFRYRPMIFVNLRFTGRGLLDDVVVWTPERSFPFFRLTEAPLAMPTLAPDGKTTITADIGAEVGDEWWTLDETTLVQRTLAALEPIVPHAATRFLGARVMRTPVAYPVFDMAYEDERQALEGGLPVEGLFSVGRNGEFRHILMEDVYWRTLRHAQDVVATWRGQAEGRSPLYPVA